MKREANVNGVKVCVMRPTIEDSRRADWEYSKTYNESMLNGIQTESQMTKLMQERGIWTEDNNEEVQTIRDQINEEITLLTNDTSLGIIEKFRLKQSISINRLQLMYKNNQYQSLIAHTCESKADEARLMYLTQKCARRSESPLVPYWKTLDDMKNETNQELAQQVMREVIMFLNDLPSDITTVFPENKIEISEEALEKAYSDQAGTTEEAQEEAKDEPQTEIVEEAVEDIPAQEVVVVAEPEVIEEKAVEVVGEPNQPQLF